MAGSRVLKNRIRSTKNIRQMTRAMEAVSAVKMRRSVGLAIASRPYALAALRLLENVGSRVGDHVAPLAAVRPRKRVTLLVVTSDRGLAGAFNAQVIRAAERFVRESPYPVDVIAVGKKGREHFRRNRSAALIESFVGAGDFGAVAETRPIAELLERRFASGDADAVAVAYTNFVSALQQAVVVKELLPFKSETLRSFIDGIIPERGRYANVPKVMGLQTAAPTTLLAEPSPAAVLDKLLADLLSVEVHQAILEANASEHSSRMMAMKSASENAGELSASLTILYNKARQAQITKELSEITAGKESLGN